MRLILVIIVLICAIDAFSAQPKARPAQKQSVELDKTENALSDSGMKRVPVKKKF